MEEEKENPTLRKLNKGEVCYVERKYSVDKNFNFMGTDKIESPNDVAFIFKKLQTASIENFFIVYEPKDKKPIIQHLSMGTPSATVVYINAIRDGINRFNAEKVYLVHNHPSGMLNPSGADYKILGKCREIFGNKIQDGIILNTLSGNYSTFDPDIQYHQEKRIHNSENTIKYTTLKFDRQVFLNDVEPLSSIKSSEDVAKYLSTQRLANKDKLSVLILTRSNNVVANIHLSTGKITENNYLEVANDISAYTARFGGCSAIIYGKDKEIEFGNIQQFQRVKEIKAVLEIPDNLTTSNRSKLTTSKLLFFLSVLSC